MPACPLPAARAGAAAPAVSIAPDSAKANAGIVVDLRLLMVSPLPVARPADGTAHGRSARTDADMRPGARQRRVFGRSPARKAYGNGPPQQWRIGPGARATRRLG
ncbi:hypothetical protein GCM10010253_23670 [Streptomyces badius]|uniref:Uncharacterized protein n=1 Tax=Streptomyces badius TaxID=1941 RepID=A0ABQ2T2R5_STRBA|nr:hypothetical protein GCM10010253_23670 [Streptomyces badius]